MAEKEELTLVQIRERMNAIEDLDIEDTIRLVEDYLGSRLVNASMMGRGYAIGDPKERRQFAEWMVGLLDEVYRYQLVMEGENE